jgi:hypothetical protein
LVLPQLTAEDSSTGLGDALFARIQRSVEEVLPSVAVGLLERFAVSFDVGLLWQDLSELETELNGDGQLAYFAAGSAATLASMFSAGYVLWTIKGGWLASSVLAQMPAWRLMDPLVVLEHLDKELSEESKDGKREDDDSLESLLADDDESSEPAAPADDEADATLLSSSQTS